MFELNGTEYSREQLELEAKKQNVSFDLFMNAMKNRGMVEKKMELSSSSFKQPKDSKDVVKNLINIDNNTTYEKDIDLKQSVLERYFEAPDVDLSKIEGAKTIDSPMGQGVDWSTIKFEDAATASEDQLKEHFGEEKYNLYKKYKETGSLNIEDIPDSILPEFKEIQNEQTKKREWGYILDYEDIPQNYLGALETGRYFSRKYENILDMIQRVITTIFGLIFLKLNYE